MMISIEIIDIITFLVASFWLMKNIKKIGKDSRFVVGALIYVFYVLPIGLDWFYEFADYTYFPDRYGFIWPRKDFLTNFLYNALMLVTLYCVLYKNTQANKVTIKSNVMSDKKFTILLYMGMVFPVFSVVFLLHEPNMLFAFQWREMGVFNDQGTYSTIERFTYIGISCALLLFFKKTNKNFIYSLLLKLIAIAFVIMNVCIQGKRAILFYAIINLMLLFYFQLESWRKEGKNIKIRLIPIVLLAIYGFVFMVSFTSFVKAGRGYEEGTAKMYTITRIDMFRDDRVRMAIYYSIYSKFDGNVPSILSYPGQSFISDFMSFIPLNYIAESMGIRDVKYQTRFTHALIGKDPNKKLDKDESWMTVTAFAEIISNVEVLLAFLLIPFLCLWTSKMIDKYVYPNNALILSSFVLLQLFDFTYVSVFIEFTIILCYLASRKKMSVQKEQNKPRYTPIEDIAERVLQV